MKTIQPAEPPTFEPLSQRVARRLRARMAELQLNGTDVAAAIEMTQGSFSRRYTGAAPWMLDELEVLEARVGISLAYLLGWDDPAASPATGAIPHSAPPAPLPPVSLLGPVPAEDRPQPPQPPAPPRLQYVDPTPIRFDRAAWPGHASA